MTRITFILLLFSTTINAQFGSAPSDETWIPYVQNYNSTRWTNSEMKSRWVAVALLEIENKMRRVNNYEKLHLLRTALKTELNIKQQKVA